MINQTNIGLQPYDSCGEAKDHNNTVKIFYNEIWLCIAQYIVSYNIALDVGCGNGRLCKLLALYFNKVHGIDKYMTPSPMFFSPLITYYKQSFEEFCIYGVKYDLILFMGTFYLFDFIGYYNILLKAKNLLSDKGVILIVDDKKRNSNIQQSGYYNLSTICDSIGANIKKQFVQDNNVHQITIIG